MKRYHIVIFKAHPERVEVVVRDYSDSSRCPTCKQTHNPHGLYDGRLDREEVARLDGRDFGQMLMEVGSQEYRRGLLEVLTV